MFRELAITNGFMTRDDIQYNEGERYSTRDGKYKCYARSGVEAHEKLSLQYCIENGVRLEWLKQAHIDSCDESETQSFHIDRGSYIFTNQYSKVTKHIYDLFICDDKIEIIKPINLCGKVNREWALFGDDSFSKLIAAIFAHDIKIIAT